MNELKTDLFAPDDLSGLFGTSRVTPVKLSLLFDLTLPSSPFNGGLLSFFLRPVSLQGLGASLLSDVLRFAVLARAIPASCSLLNETRRLFAVI